MPTEESLPINTWIALTAFNVARRKVTTLIGAGLAAGLLALPQRAEVWAFD